MIDANTMRTLKARLFGPMPKMPPIKASELHPDVHLTVGSAVKLGNRGYMHPYSFRDLFGEEAYNEVLSRPRIVCEYDEPIQS